MTTPPRLTTEDRHLIGNRLRLLRLERRLEQRTVARRAGVAMGTLQMLERGAGRDVREQNISKVAEALGTTLVALRTHPDVQASTATLNREDIEIAGRFHTAIINVKLAVRALLAFDSFAERQRDQVAQLVQEIITIRDGAYVAFLIESVRVHAATGGDPNGKRKPKPVPGSTATIPRRKQGRH